MKNETTYDRLIALENRMNMFPMHVQSGSIENHERTILRPTEESMERIQTSVPSNFHYNSGKNYDPTVLYN